MDGSPQVLEMLPNMRFHHDAHLLTWHPHGAVDDDFLDQLVEFAEKGEAAAESPFHRFTDLNGLTTVKLSFGHLYRISQRRRATYPWRTPVKSAFYCERGIGYAFARIYAALMEGSPIEVRAFRAPEPAAEWLGVPLDLLNDSSPVPN